MLQYASGTYLFNIIVFEKSQIIKTRVERFLHIDHNPMQLLPVNKL